MNRSLPSLITGVLLALLLVLYMVTFQVRSTEVAVVRTFGQARAPQEGDPGSVRTEAGLYWKWPWPVQQVSIYDNRIQMTGLVGEEVSIGDKTVVLTTATGWRIGNPYKFSISCGSMEEAQSRLITLVRAAQKSVLNRYRFDQLVSMNREELRYDETVAEILKEVSGRAAETLGIEAKSVHIEGLALPQRITESVFAAMRKEREARAAEVTSRGESEAQQIRDTAEGIAGVVLSFADLQAAKIVAEGQRRAAEYNKVFSQDEELAKLLIQADALPRILGERTTILLDAGSAGLSLLRGLGRPAVQATATRPADMSAVAARNGAVLPEVLLEQPR